MNSLNTGKTSEKRTEQVEREIGETRTAIKEDLRALGEKVSPGHLKEEAVQAMRGKAATTRDAVGHRVGDLTRAARDRLQSGATSLKSNPLALVGGALVVGLALGLALPTTEREARMLAEPAKKARAQAREILKEGRETTRRVREELQEAGSEAKEALRGTEGSV